MLVLSLLQTWMRRRRLRRGTSVRSAWRPLVHQVRPMLETLEDRVPLGNILGPGGLSPNSFVPPGNNLGFSLADPLFVSPDKPSAHSPPGSLPPDGLGGMNYVLVSALASNAPPKAPPPPDGQQPPGDPFGLNGGGSGGGLGGGGSGGGGSGTGGSGGTTGGGGDGASILSQWAQPLNPLVKLKDGTDRLNINPTIGDPTTQATTPVGNVPSNPLPGGPTNPVGTGVTGDTGPAAAAVSPNLTYKPQPKTPTTGTGNTPPGKGVLPGDPGLGGSTGQPPLGQVTPTNTGTYGGSMALVNLEAGLSQAVVKNQADAYLKQQGKYFVIDIGGRALVNARTDARANIALVQQALTSQGQMSVTTVTAAQGLITGFVPINQLHGLTDIPGVVGLSPVYAPHYSAAPVDEGDHVIKADAFRASTGLTGAGVNVGVISDSVNQVNANVDATGDKGLAQSQRLGALPAGVNVLRDGTINATDEGRGMLELIHQVAPGANLAFATAQGGPQAQAQSISDLATVDHARVIVDDAQYPNEPFFNDGVLAKAVDNTAINNNVVYLAAAGNLGNNGWQDGFRPQQAQVAGSLGTFANLDGKQYGQVLQHFHLDQGQTLDLSFQWDAAFLEGGSTLPQYQVPNEMDVLVTSADGQQLVQRFGDNNPLTGEALQRVVFTNNGTTGGSDFALAFQLVSGPAPTELKWIRFDSGKPADFQGAPTIYGHAAALNAVAVGAVAWNTPNTPEAFSSQGKVSIYFDANGKRLGSPVDRFKPDVAGPDQVHAASFPGQTTPLANGTFPVYAGTSAAAANLAGGVALIVAQNPTDNYWAAVLRMEHEAVPVDSATWSATTGFGLDPLNPAPPTLPINNSSWTLLGPAPEDKLPNVGGNPSTSGRITGIATDPTNANRIFVAAAGGGIWRTLDGGANWTPVSDGEQTLFMGSIAMSASDPNTLYAGTGESNNSGDSFYGRGVLKSTDGGNTWLLETDNGIFNRLVSSRIAIDPTNPSIVYVAINNNGVNGSTAATTGIYKTTDGGATWTNTTTKISAGANTDEYTDIFVTPGTPTKLFMAIGNTAGSADNGIYISNNSGGSWTLAGNAPAGSALGNVKLGISKADPKTIYAPIANPGNKSLARISKTTDGGVTWNDVKNEPVDYMNGQGDYDNAVAVDPANAGIVYVGGAFNGTDSNSNFINQVLRSADGGSTWVDYTIGKDGLGVHPDHHALVFDGGGKLIDGEDGGVFRLQDATPTNITWNDLNTNLATMQNTGVDVHPTDPNIAYVGSQDNGTGKFTGTLNWANIAGGDGGFVRVDYTTPATIYHTFFYGNSGFIERSDDAGATFTGITNGIGLGDTSNFYTPYELDPTTSTRLILGTDHVYETTDKGANWKAIGTPNQGGFNKNGDPINSLQIAKTDPNTIYVAAGAHFFVTSDKGATWTQRDIPNVTDVISYLIIDPSDKNIVYAARGAFGTGKVFRTADGGKTWTDITGNLPDLPTYSLVLVTNSFGSGLMAGNDNGVFFTVDQGKTWTRLGFGLPDVQVVEMTYNATLDILTVATHGRAVWQINPNFTTGGGGGGGGTVATGSDTYDPNNTADTAHDFGLLTVAAGKAEYNNLSIIDTPAGLPNYDWFKWTMEQDGFFTVNLRTTVGGDLLLQVYSPDGNGTMIKWGQDMTPNSSRRKLFFNVQAGQTLYVEVHGRNSAPGVLDTGFYNLDVQNSVPM